MRGANKKRPISGVFARSGGPQAGCIDPAAEQLDEERPAAARECAFGLVETGHNRVPDRAKSFDSAAALPSGKRVDAFRGKRPERLDRGRVDRGREHGQAPEQLLDDDARRMGGTVSSCEA